MSAVPEVPSTSKKRRFDDDGWGGWKGYMQHKQSKLDEQFAADSKNGSNGGDRNVESDAKNIFKGISIYVNGHTTPSADQLKQLIMSYGGSYHYYYNGKNTSHVIASTLPNSKMKNLRKQKIVRPEWIVESVRSGRLLSHLDYSVYETSQPMLQFAPKVTSGPSEDFVEDSFIGITSFEDQTLQEVATKSGSKLMTCSDASETNKGFLSEFHSRSRLHHISTMGTEFREYVDRLRDSSDGKFVGIERLRKWIVSTPKEDEVDLNWNEGNEWKQVVMHIDMDCFFVSVGLRKRPELRGLPVAVTHSRGNGPSKSSSVQKEGTTNRTFHCDGYGSTSEIACCNYEARKAGVRNGSWLGDAKKLCPNIVTIPYDFEEYKEVAQKLYNIVASYTLDIEAVSCDEMFVDCLRILEASGATPQQFASCIRNDVFRETNCTCSVGIARNFLLARIATKKAKPNGQMILCPEQEADFVRTEEVSNLPGVGRSLGSRLKLMEVETCADLQEISVNVLKKEFGPKMGQTLYNMSRGIDDRVVRQHRSRHSVSAEVNYGIRFTKLAELQKLLNEIAVEVQTRLRKIETKGKTITLKLKVRKAGAPLDTVKFMGHGLCDNLARAVTLAQETDSAEIIARESEKLFRQIEANVSDIRGVGIQVSRLMSNETVPQSNTLTQFLNSRKEVVSKQMNPGSSYVEETRTEWSPLQKSVNFAVPLTSYSSPKRDGVKSSKPIPRKPSPKKPSPVKTIPFKYLSIDKHFATANSRPSSPIIGSASSRNVHESLHNETNSRISSPIIRSTILRSLRVETGVAVDSNDEEQGEQQHGLCGAMSFEEMKTLFKEWTETYDVPMDEDVNIVKESLSDAIVRHEMEKAYILLQMLHRLITRKRKSRWRLVYNNVVDEVQATVNKMYGGHMKLEVF